MTHAWILSLDSTNSRNCGHSPIATWTLSSSNNNLLPKSRNLWFIVAIWTLCQDCNCFDRAQLPGLCFSRGVTHASREIDKKTQVLFVFYWHATPVSYRFAILGSFSIFFVKSSVWVFRERFCCQGWVSAYTSLFFHEKPAKNRKNPHAGFRQWECGLAWSDAPIVRIVE